MQKNPIHKAREFIEQNHKRRFWKKIVTVLASLAVFSTTYMLILPALTLEENTYCGSEEHQHDDSCYEKQLVCDEEEGSSHKHTDSCYEEQSVLVCEQEESLGHIHDDSCIQQNQILICNENHEHTEECYQTEDSYICGLTEGEGAHTHSSECYETQNVLTCQKSEQVHEHTDSCYEDKLICQKEEHIHSLACYSDTTADLETQDSWEQTISNVSLTGDFSDDVVAIAKSQLGYTESEKNYVVAEDGTTNGYTRYGAWYGNPYDEWDAMFAAFCFHYAGIQGYPVESSPEKWMEQLIESGLYSDASLLSPENGELVFLDDNQDGKAEHVGIISEIKNSESEPSLSIIEGDYNNSVQVVNYSIDDSKILGYGIIPVSNQETTISTVDEKENESDISLSNTMLTSAPNYIGAIDTANEWQIVAEKFVGNANENKIGYDTDGDGINDVFLQKNVVSTANENEFLVYLSMTKQMTWDSLLAQSQLGLTTQGKWTDSDVGSLVNRNEIGGNKSNILQPGKGQRNYEATIYLQKNGVTVHTFTGWYNGTTPNASNCTGYIILNGLNNKAIIASAKVNLHQDSSGSGGTLSYTIDLDTMANHSIFYAVEEITLDSVEDKLGENIIYKGLVACDGSVSESNKTLKWNIVENADVTGVNYTDPVTGYLENVAQLVYRVELDVNKDDFHSCANNMNSEVGDDESYAVNEYATLSYRMGSNTHNQNFLVPYVRGLLYDITFNKQSSTGKSLAGAVFELFQSDGETPVLKKDGSPYTITTEAEITSEFINLPYGSYVLKEISAPKYYSAGDTSSWTIELCYTTNSSVLEIDGLHPTNYRFNDNDENGTWVIVNPRNEYTYQIKVIKTNESGDKFLKDVSFSIKNGLDELNESTDENGTITFDSTFHPNIEYTLNETNAPDGYQLLPTGIRFVVRDDLDTDTQSVELVNSDELKGLVSLELKEADDKPMLIIHVINQQSYELPETGGSGTTLFTLCGICLIAISLVYKYSIRKE